MLQVERIKKQNKLIACICIAAVMLTVGLGVAVSALQADEGGAEYSGKCGDELYWEFDSGTLTVTGKGDMYDFYEPDMAPWYDLRGEIYSVSFSADMTSVGKLAFYGCDGLVSVLLPDKVKRIGNHAFAECTALKMLDLGEALVHIGKAAFYGCVSLDAVRLPYGVQSIDDQAFYRCESMTGIELPEHLTSLGNSVFAYCKSLVYARVYSRLDTLPTWTFYGCESLSEVMLADTVSSVESYSFRHCEALSVIYYDGDSSVKEKLRVAISEESEGFSGLGYISSGTPSDTVISSVDKSTDENNILVENTKVTSTEDITLVVRVENENNGKENKVSAEIDITLEEDADLSEAGKKLTETVTDIKNTYPQLSESVVVNLNNKGNEAVNAEFLSKAALNDLELNVTSQSGSSWKINSKDMEKVEHGNFISYSFDHRLSTATIDTLQHLKTENGYHLTFDNDVEINAEVVVQLPRENSYSNAFLYQIEKNGDYTRLQAVQIDGKGKAHFYLASVSKDTVYVVGIDVPDEKTEDVIIPDEVLDEYQIALDRLQNVEYVVTGRTSSWGMGIGTVTWIMVGVIVATIVAVGIVMTVMNKRKIKNYKA